MRIGRTAGVVLATAALAAGIGLSTIPAAASGSTTTNVNVTGPVNGDSYTAAMLAETTVINSNWTIVNETLTVTGSYGWVSTFTVQIKSPIGVNSTTSSYSGSVTDTTEYGTATATFAGTGALGNATTANPISSGIGTISADNGVTYEAVTTAVGTAILNTQTTLASTYWYAGAGWYFGW